jgi:hypothetical protein
MKNSSDTIGNRTRDLPACSAVPQPTAPPRAPFPNITKIKQKIMKWTGRVAYIVKKNGYKSLVRNRKWKKLLTRLEDNIKKYVGASESIRNVLF